MPRKQLAALFVCNLVPIAVGNALLALLPVYATDLGADKVTTGIYLSLSFAALACGTIIGGWLSDRFQKRKLTLVLIGVVSVPVIFLMGQVGSVALLTLFTMIAWLVGGVSAATVNILTAMYADPRQRGRIFGIIGTTGSLGQVIGGLMSGTIVDRWGYPALFTFTALIWIVAVVAALFLEDRVITHDRPERIQPQAAAAPFNSALWLLIAASIVAPVASFTVGLARPLMMNDLGFSATDISSAVTVSGLIALPMSFLVGWLSDRIGRKQLLMISYALASMGALVLISALNLWQFWFSACLFALSGSALSVGLAFVTDLVSPQSLSTVLARFSATNFIAGVIGFGATGLIIQQLGMTNTLVIGATIPVLGIVLILAIRKGVRVAPA